jgi:hypothetical protein
MVDGDARADRVLAGVEMRQQQLAAGDFDVAHQHWRGVDARRLAHEVDGAVARHLELDGVAQSGLQAGFHRWAP